MLPMLGRWGGRLKRGSALSSAVLSRTEPVQVSIEAAFDGYQRRFMPSSRELKRKGTSPRASSKFNRDSQRPVSFKYQAMLKSLADKGATDAMEALMSEMRLSGIPLDAVHYTCLLGAYGKTNKPHQAEFVLERMKQENVAPTVATYTALVAMFGKEQAFGKMRLYLEEMLMRNIKPNLHTMHVLLGAYGDAGLLHLMETTYLSMGSVGINPTSLTFNLMLKAYSQAGAASKIKDTFTLMKKQRCKPDIRSYNIAISGFGSAGELEDVISCVGHLLKSSKMKPDSYTMTAVVQALIDCNAAKSHLNEIVGKFKAAGVVYDTATYTALLKAYHNYGSIPELMSTLKEMVRAIDVNGNTRPFLYALEVCTRAGDDENAALVREMMSRNESKESYSTYTTMLRAHLEAADIESAAQILEKIVSRGMVYSLDPFKLLTAAIEGVYDPDLLVIVAQKLTKCMKKLKVSIDLELFEAAGKICGRTKNSQVICELLSVMTAYRFQEWQLLSSTMSADLLLAVDHIDDYRAIEALVVNASKNPDFCMPDPLYMRVIHKCDVSSGVDNVRYLLKVADRSTQPPSRAVFNKMLDALIKHGNTNDVTAVLACLKRKRRAGKISYTVGPDNQTYSVLITHFGQRKILEQVERYWNELRNRSDLPTALTSWESYIGALCDCNQYAQTEEFILQMQREGVTPSWKLMKRLIIHAVDLPQPNESLIRLVGLIKERKIDVDHEDYRKVKQMLSKVHGKEVEAMLNAAWEASDKN